MGCAEAAGYISMKLQSERNKEREREEGGTGRKEDVKREKGIDMYGEILRRGGVRVTSK